MMMTGKKLMEFYREFFNHNFFRDIDYILGQWWNVKDGNPKDKTDRLRYKVKKNTGDLKSIELFKKKSRYFLVDKHHRDSYGQLVHHNSYFKSVPDFHGLNNNDRLYDRLFYDIDKHNSVIDGFKHTIEDIKASPLSEISYKEKLKQINSVHNQYQEYVFSNDFLLEPFNDAMKVIKFYQDRGTEPILIATGGAGFHINVLFEPVHLTNPNNVFLSYNNMIMNKTGVNSLDPAPPKNAVIGTQRTPYGIHEKSGLYGFIIPSDWSYDDVMQVMERNKLNVTDFSYDDHLVPDLLREQIINTDVNAGHKKLEKKEQSIRKSNSHLNKSWTVHVDGIGDVSMGIEHDINLKDDLRILWDLMVDDGMASPVDDRNIREHYNRVRCPFPDHEDRNPSAICGKYRFKCFKCCPDGINWYMLIAVTYGIVSPEDINKDVTPEQKQEIRKVIRKLTGKSID